MPSPARHPVRIGFLLSQLGARAAGIFADQLDGLGLTPSEAGVIRIISRTPRLTQRELAERLGTVPSRVVALIDGLERKGLAARTRDETDRRAHYLELTDSGRAMLGELRKAAEAQEATITASLSERQCSELGGLLATLSSGLGLDPDVHPGYRATAPIDTIEGDSAVTGGRA